MPPVLVMYTMYRPFFCFSIQPSSELGRPWLSLNPTTFMFQIDSLSNPLGGGTSSGGRPAAPSCPSLSVMVGMFGPSGGEA